MSMKPCPETFPYPLIALDETDSTNRYISQLCNELQESVAELTTVTAEFQTAGKGQRGAQHGGQRTPYPVAPLRQPRHGNILRRNSGVPQQ